VYTGPRADRTRGIAALIETQIFVNSMSQVCADKGVSKVFLHRLSCLTAVTVNASSIILDSHFEAVLSPALPLLVVELIHELACGIKLVQLAYM
jgi:hypothetical protein